MDWFRGLPCAVQVVQDCSAKDPRVRVHNLPTVSLNLKLEIAGTVVYPQTLPRPLQVSKGTNDVTKTHGDPNMPAEKGLLKQSVDSLWSKDTVVNDAKERAIERIQRIMDADIISVTGETFDNMGTTLFAQPRTASLSDALKSWRNNTKRILADLLRQIAESRQVKQGYKLQAAARTYWSNGTKFVTSTFNILRENGTTGLLSELRTKGLLPPHGAITISKALEYIPLMNSLVHDSSSTSNNEIMKEEDLPRKQAEKMLLLDYCSSKKHKPVDEKLLEAASSQIMLAAEENAQREHGFLLQQRESRCNELQLRLKFLEKGSDEYCEAMDELLAITSKPAPAYQSPVRTELCTL